MNKICIYLEFLCPVLVEGGEGEALGVLLGQLAELKVVFGVEGGGHRHVVFEELEELLLQEAQVLDAQILEDRNKVHIPHGQVFPHCAPIKMNYSHIKRKKKQNGDKVPLEARMTVERTMRRQLEAWRVMPDRPIRRSV
jgi:hypothetical protein